jgi:HPt (histidine-containing phosphotransfer) domain-containing protein
MQADRDRCLDAGMNDFVTKPITPETLWQALLQWIKLRDGLGPKTQSQSQLPLASPPTGEDAAQTLEMLQTLRRIADLNVDLGLLRTSNKPDFYVAMLRKFVVSQQDATQRIREALQAQDVSTAERYAHTLKSVAGNLGASALQHAADALEAALRQGLQAPIQAALSSTEGLLMHLVGALKASPALIQVTIAARLRDLTEDERNAAHQVARQIKHCLRQDDASASELWDTHAVVLRALYPNAQAIEAAISNFEFETALALMHSNPVLGS